MCGKFKLHNDAPMLRYRQRSLNSCCFIGLASYFASIKQTKSANAISLRIEESLKSKMGNHVDFANAIVKNEKNLKASQECIIA